MPAFRCTCISQTEFDRGVLNKRGALNLRLGGGITVLMIGAYGNRRVEMLKVRLDAKVDESEWYPIIRHQLTHLFGSDWTRSTQFEMGSSNRLLSRTITSS